MLTKLVELTNNINWGKFLVGRFDEAEWSYRSEIACGARLLSHLGWDDKHVWVLDLATGEGALFRPGGRAAADLEKHRVWVCPMFEVFLGWLYAHPECWSDLSAIPKTLVLTDEEALAATSLYGRRRGGPGEQLVHVLRYGFAICGFSTAVPREWPRGDRWVDVFDWEKATCAGCRSRAPELLARVEAERPVCGKGERKST